MGEKTDEELMALAADEMEGFGGKAVPYTGWYWRGWGGCVSLVSVDGRQVVAIDEARKWDYPMTRVSPDDEAEVRRLLIEMGRAKQRLLAILESYREKLRHAR